MPFASFATNQKVPYSHPAPVDLADVFIATGTPAVLASAGSTAANSAPIAEYVTNVTGGDGTKGVTLPAFSATGAVGGRVGEAFTIFNNSAAILKVWPPTGAAINTGAADAVNNLAAGLTATYIRYSSTLFLRVG